MPPHHLKRFFISIVFPSILAVVFIMVLIFALVIPVFERNIMAGKKEMISELTNMAWSLLEEYQAEVVEGRMAADSAKVLAAERIGKVRYGEEYKDYFWIIDERPVMIMHPYRPELEGRDLSDYEDPDGKLLFVESVKVVEAQDEGYIDYMWQWKDDSTRIVPKLSYVKGFEPWDWIVGTGIYLEDVRAEMTALKNRLLRITLLFTVLISSILAFIIRQSLVIERRRSEAEKKLRLSRQKYKSLVEASTEGTLMMVGEEIIFCNMKFGRLSGYAPSAVLGMRFEGLFDLPWEKLVGLFGDPGQSVSHDTMLKCRDGIRKEVVLSVSQVSHAEETGYIIVVKEVTAQRQLEKETELLSGELQALLLMNQPVRPLVDELLKIPSTATIREAAQLMTRKNRDVLFIVQEGSVIGVLNNGDLKRRVVAAGADPDGSVLGVMTSPVETISGDALLYEVLLALRTRKVSHLVTIDAGGNYSGVIGLEQIMEMHRNAISFLIREIGMAEDVNQLVQIYKRVPVLVRALIGSGDKSENINRIITSVADAMHRQVAGFAVEELGPAPCAYAFMVMGSEGRGEQTLATDQDNAIVYEDIAEGGDGGSAESAGKDDVGASGKNAGKDVGMDVEKDPAMDPAEVQRYFLKLGERVNRDLHAIGYNYCKGEVMARNPKWTRPLSAWKAYFSQWINNSTPQDILEAAIFFDFRYIHGEKRLTDELREHVIRTSENKPVFYYHMAQSVQKFKPPLNIFGRITGRDSGDDALQLDIKKAMMPVLTFARLYAIREQLSVVNSLERLHALADRKVVDSGSYEELTEAYELMMYLRLKFQVESIQQNDVPGNIIDLNRLTRMEAAMLKRVLSQVAGLQSQVSFEFKG